ncbi:DUF4145 domain-containing protein [Clostridium estertheticum]|uniref:DUF4145 domain-containing protein n=1 Tax=Clostridium estertheticum TaxID=238834 RepID=UPI001C0BD83E|nr:DUF4145 domain-containing protein [Clostridium estertheticum]MBU3187212.1 DUF4145 domain-containing protein [Clostridium estertheticum]
MNPFKWTCPYCNHDTTIAKENFLREPVTLSIENIQGNARTFTEFIVCPNPDCNEVTISLELYEVIKNGNLNPYYWDLGELVKSWRLLPGSGAKTFPNYVPKVILDDYIEACLIKDLTPKASATLSRRCLQGIIRDFWKIKKPRLVDEIEAIKNKIDPLTWEAIDSVRKIGNSGAHMEKDINQIVDVDSSESALLIELIETLIKDLYITKYERELRLKAIIEIKNRKQLEKKN